MSRLRAAAERRRDTLSLRGRAVLPARRRTGWLTTDDRQSGAAAQLWHSRSVGERTRQWSDLRSERVIGDMD